MNLPRESWTLKMPNQCNTHLCTQAHTDALTDMHTQNTGHLRIHILHTHVNRYIFTCLHVHKCIHVHTACTYIHAQTCTFILKCTYKCMHKHVCNLSTHMPMHMHTYICTYAHLVQGRGAGQLPVLRAALSTPISAAKAVAYGEGSCCRDGKSIKHPEENYTDRRVPVRRDHIRRSVVVEVSHPLIWVLDQDPIS